MILLTLAIVLQAKNWGGVKFSDDPVVRKAEKPFIELSKEMSGFAGYHLDKEGEQLIVLAKNLEKASTIKSTVRSYVNNVYQRAGLQFNDSEVSLKSANFSYTELSNWRDKIIKAIFDVDGVVSFDLAEDKNALLVGILNYTNRAQIETLLEGLNVPQGMIQIYKTGKLKSLKGKGGMPFFKDRTGQSALTLEDVVRPLIPGTEIQRVTPISGQQFPEITYCTIGFNAVLGNKDVFFTNSHCTEIGSVWQVNASSDYHQSDRSSAPASIGTEIYDPAGSECFVLWDCRYSDAAAIEKTDTLSWDFGFVPKTEGLGINWTPGSKTIIQPKLEIVDDDINVMVNLPVTKMGKSSGWTAGFVGQTCTTEVWDRGSDILLLCQNAVDGMYAEGGDSGSPVFDVLTTSNGEVELAGILYAIRAEEELAYFSHMEGVRQDFASFGTLEIFEPPLSVAINGPAFIDQASVYNWSANVQNQDGSVSYQWSIKYSGISTWSNLGTNSSQLVNVTNDTDFTIRVTVVDASDDATALRSVTVNLGGCSPADPC